jgi:hypothetical protein
MDGSDLYTLRLGSTGGNISMTLDKIKFTDAGATKITCSDVKIVNITAIYIVNAP